MLTIHPFHEVLWCCQSNGCIKASVWLVSCSGFSQGGLKSSRIRKRPGRPGSAAKAKTCRESSLLETEQAPAGQPAFTFSVTE